MLYYSNETLLFELCLNVVHFHMTSISETWPMQYDENKKSTTYTKCLHVVLKT